MGEQEFIDRFIALLEASGKHPSQDITGYRAIEIIKKVYDIWSHDE